MQRMAASETAAVKARPASTQVENSRLHLSRSPSPQRVAHKDGGPGAQADDGEQHDVHHRRGHPQGGQSLLAHKPAHDDRVGGVVELLKNIAHQQRQRKAQDVAGDVAGGHVGGGGSFQNGLAPFTPGSKARNDCCKREIKGRRGRVIRFDLNFEGPSQTGRRRARPLIAPLTGPGRAGKSEERKSSFIPLILLPRAPRCQPRPPPGGLRQERGEKSPVPGRWKAPDSTHGWCRLSERGAARGMK